MISLKLLLVFLLLAIASVSLVNAQWGGYYGRGYGGWGRGYYGRGWGRPYYGGWGRPYYGGWGYGK